MTKVYAVAQSVPEPVAWMYEDEYGSREWFSDQFPQLAERGWTETPLYTRIEAEEPAAEPPADATIAALREALEAFMAGDIDVSGTALIYDADVRSMMDLARAALEGARQ